MPILANMKTSHALARAFEGLPAKVRQTNRPDCVAITLGRSRYEFRLKSAGEGWPSDVQRVLSNERAPWPRDEVVIARHFSPGAIRLLRSRNANWIDAAGNVYIYAPPALLIDRSAPPSASPAGSRFSWHPSSIDIAEELLSTPRERIRVIELARDSGWSPPQVASVLHGFDEMGWTRRHGAAGGPSVWRELINPGSMLEAWSAYLATQKFPVRAAHALMRDPTGYLTERIAPALNANNTEWAATTWVAANLLAPYSALLPSLHLYVPDEFLLSRSLETAIEASGLREVESGANVEFRGADARVFKHLQMKQIPIVSSPRVYADLLALRGRAEDAAKYLRETVLGY